MKKLILVTSSLIFCLSVGQAQEYNSAIGARLGYPLSASYKTFLNESNALELIAGFRSFSSYNWITAGAAYQVHQDISGVDGLQWYYGLGLSAYFWSFDVGFLGDNSSTTFGVQGYAGLDYTFSDLPLSITADWVPTYFINGFGSGFGGGYGALGVRYTISK